MGRAGKLEAVGLIALALVLAVFVLTAPGAGAATERPGALDPTFGHGGRAIAESTFETAPSKFTAVAAAPNGDLVLELQRQSPGEESAREIELRSPSGTLVPSFGTEGKLTVGGGAGIATLADGDILVGVDDCDGAASSVTMIDPSGAPVPSFGKDGCGAAVPFEVKLMTLDDQGRILLLGTRSYCSPCYHDALPSIEAVVARILPGGGRDPSFGKNGVVGTHLDDHLEEGVNPDGEYNPTGLAAAPGGVLISKGPNVIRLDEAGALDMAFGEGGLAAVPGHTGPLAVGADGSIFVVSAEYSEETSSVTRLDPNGTPVPSFGPSGTVPLPFPSRTSTEEEQIATTPGGGVVVGAGVFPGKDCVRSCEEGSALTRLTATGQPDTSYGTAGIAPVDLTPPRLPEPTVLRSLFVGADGSAVVAGSDEDGDAFAAAFTPDGAPQGSFGEGGILGERHVQPAVLESTGLFERPHGGFTVAAQRSTAPGLRTAFLVDFDADGRQQPFPDGTLATETLAHGLIVPDGDGQPVAWGGDGERDRVLLAAGPVGQLLDESYGKDGSARFPKGLYPLEVAPAPGGGAAVVGVIEGAMAVFRVGPEGHPVQGFGHDGLAIVRFPHAAAIGFAGIVEADGDVVLTGSVGDYAGAARLLPDGRLDRRFGHGGRVRRLLGKDSFGQRIAPWHGGVVIAADQEATPRRSASLIRLHPDGRVDRSFGRDGVVRAGAEKPPLALLTEAGHVVVVTNPSLERGHHGAGVELRAYGAKGSVDRAFGQNGVRFYGSGTGNGRPFFPAVAIQQPDGKIVVAGTMQGRKLEGRYSGPRTRAVLVRFLLR